MTRINLLPWREARRKERERQFISTALGALLLMGAIIFYAHIYVGQLTDHQDARNAFLAEGIAEFDRKIAEIKTLETEKTRLLARMSIIQQLQSSRPMSVHLVNELAKTLPEGIYYTSVKHEGASLTLEGIAQSNARVSSLMRNLEASPWLENPVLEVIETKEENAARTTRYTLRVQQRGSDKDENDVVVATQ